MLKPGDIVHRYKILETLSAGGFGETYKVQDIHGFHPISVLKKLQPFYQDSAILQDAQKRFFREAKVLQKLGEHPQIPDIYDYFEHEQNLYIVMELIEGVELTKELQDKKKFTQNEAIDLLLEILEVLNFVHQDKTIHRDIKPSNLIRRNSDRKVILIDFGLVKQVEARHSNSEQVDFTAPIGTMGYTAPEQWEGNPQFSSDVYSLGIVCIKALKGWNFDINKMTRDPQKNLIWCNPAHDTDVTQGFKNLLNKMTRHHYQERYEDADNALEAVRNLQ